MKTDLQKRIFRTQLILIITLTLFLGIAGSLINIRFETEKRDQTLRNIADTVVHSLVLTEGEDGVIISDKQKEYLEFLKNTIEDVDVISIVDLNDTRIFHSTEKLIGTHYDGTHPKFNQESDDYDIENDIGPSGTQRRAYAAIYDESGEYIGFVMTVSLMENIYHDILQILIVFGLVMLVAIFMELLISSHLSNKIKGALNGYEPDVFSAMYHIRDNIIESLEEGVIATNTQGEIQFVNRAGERMLGDKLETFDFHTADFENENILIEKIPIKENEQVVGTVGILRDRAEYTKLMEDLAGTRYLVDSMRASNHDFTNKLHVILGLIQMEMYKEAESYIQNITVVHREMISKIMKAIDEPALAALLIGKLSRASELNVKFILRDNVHFSKAAFPLSSDVLVTVVGNLIDNAFEAMNTDNYTRQKELVFGIYSKQGELLITVNDTGNGISDENREKIFDNGFSTKGEGRGTGLYQVKSVIERLGGTITVESETGVGTAFTVLIKK
ncbi:MAG: ATP-binding protein [Faecalimonas sp.]|nr:ATP-binding protein [Faecalimonas sp.]